MAKFIKTVTLETNTEDEARKVADALSQMYAASKNQISTAAFLKMIESIKKNPSKIKAAQIYL